MAFFIKQKVEEALVEEKLIDKKNPEQGMTTPLKVLAGLVFLRFLIPGESQANPDFFSSFLNQTLSV